MQFKHPEVLYALLLLLIPLFIHLFQFRKYQTVLFTNVAFLKKVKIETRKSSRLKKWLTLLLRMLAIACMVLAFAQPFTASETATRNDKELVLYLDNSFSMQLAGNSGPMLKRAQQQLFDLPLPEGQFSWFTNDNTYRNTTAVDFRQEVLRTGYSHQQLNMKSRLLRAQSLFSDDANSLKRFLIVSDLQHGSQTIERPKDVELGIIKTEPVSTDNVSVDSLSVDTRNINSVKVNVWVSKTGPSTLSRPISLYREGKLMAKVGLSFEEANTQQVSFDIDQPNNFIGKVEVEDSNLLYDNTLYFNISPLKKIRVLSINQDDSAYLDRMFQQVEFDYTKQPYNAVNYSELTNQNLVVLNQLESITASLVTALFNFVESGGSIAIIPSEAADLVTYNTLLTRLGLGQLESKRTQSKKISTIRFDHPLFEGVFEKEVINFQYPDVDVYFETNTSSGAALLLEDGSPFLTNRDQAYLFTAPLKRDLSNFTSSPLIVPTLYNMAMKSLPPNQPYFQVGRENVFTVDYQLMRDEILKLQLGEDQFIPAQQNRPNGTLLTTNDLPDQAGNYRVLHKDSTLQWVSYNHDREESRLVYNNPEKAEGIRQFDSVNALIDYLSEENSIDSYWKWFVILALVFLLLELLVLKFLNV